MLGGALLVYARHSGDYERVMLRHGMLVIESAYAGHFERHEFNARWVRVEWVDGAVVRARIVLHVGQISIPVGRYLGIGGAGLRKNFRGGCGAVHDCRQVPQADLNL